MDTSYVLLFASITFYDIWHVHNEVVYSNAKVDIRSCLKTIFNSYSTFFSCLLPNTSTKPKPTWTPPLEGLVKVNFYVAFSSFEMILAIVAKDHEGSFLFATVNCHNQSTLIVGEAFTAIFGISMVVQYNFQYCIVEGDSKCVIDSLSSSTTSHWEIKQFRQVSFD